MPQWSFFKSRARTPSDLRIIPRKLRLEYRQAMEKNRYWHSNDPVVTHFFNALQATFPEGERFFIDSARDVRDALPKGDLDETLEQQIQAFIRQEAWHGREHEHWTDALVALGYDRMRGFEEQLKKMREWANEHIPAIARLSMTSASEHFTASIAWLITYRKPWLLEQADSPFRELLLYHAMEELEHKAVCFDLFQAAGGSYRLRVLGLLLSAMDIMTHVRARHIYLLKADGLWDARHRLRAWQFIWGPRGLVWDLLPFALAYLRPDFHPWRTDEREDLLNRFREIWEKIPFEALPDAA